MEKRQNQILFLFAFAVLLLAKVECQLTFQETVFVDSENPDKCYDSVIDTYFDLHSVWWRPNQCMRLTCQLGNSPESLTIVGERCQEFVAPPNCKLQSNQYVLFPGCCSKLNCSPGSVEVIDSSEISDIVDQIPSIVVEESASPSSEEEVAPPISEEEVALPISEEEVALPISEEEVASPISEEEAAPPISEETIEICDNCLLNEDKTTEIASSEEAEKIVEGEIVTETEKIIESAEVGDSLTPTKDNIPLVETTDTLVESVNEDNTITPTKEDLSVSPNNDVEPIPSLVEEAANPFQENDSLVTSTTTVKPLIETKPVLPDFDYESHATGTYKFHYVMANWEDAKLICESEGAHLAIVNSPEESEVLAKMFSVYPEDYWMPKYGKIVFASIGFHDMDVEGDYVTIFGSSLNNSGFTKFWRKNEPNNLGASATRPGEDCGSIHRNGGLNDFFCMLHLPFICEQ